MAVFSQRLDSMILVVFSSLNDSLIQPKTVKIPAASSIKENEKKYKSLGSRVILILKTEQKNLWSYSAL